MEALVVRKLGDPTTRDWESSPIVLSKEEAIPAFESPTAVRVRVKATSLNYANYLQIQGKYQEKPPLPFIPGSDYSGVVDAVGPKVSQFKVGDPPKKKEENFLRKKEEKMEALVVRKLGDPTTRDWESSPIVLSKEEAIPAFESPTAVRVRVKATSLNYANYLQIQGKYQEKPPLPFIPGSDYSGVVDAVGPKVSQFKVGDPVCSFAALGSY
nr:quinone oxidoreductase-like protein 2 [Quercus suber]